MKTKRILSTGISLILISFMLVNITSCKSKEPLPDNLVEYTDPKNRFSYTYNSSYLLDFDDPTVVAELEKTNKKQLNKLQDQITNDPDLQIVEKFYLLRNSNNKISVDSSSLFYYENNDAFDENVYQMSDDLYNQYLSLLTTLTDESVVNGSAAKYVTFGNNTFLHAIVYSEMNYKNLVTEQFIFQLKNGDVGFFTLNCNEDLYDSAYKETAKLLESFTVY